MTIYCIDNSGETAYDIDNGRIYFSDGEARFVTDGTEYRTPIADIIEIIA